MAIESLMDRRGTFDYILLETTGLADPGNLAPVFWVDDNLGSSIYLDGIVTLVDAKNILRLLDEPSPEETVSQHEPETNHSDSHSHSHSGPVLSMAHMQISHADVVVLNKADLVSPAELERVRARVSAINSAAKIHVTDHGKTPQIEGVVLDLHAYDNVTDLDFADKGHSHIDPVISPSYNLAASPRGKKVHADDDDNNNNQTNRQSQPYPSLTPQSPPTRSPSLTPGSAPSSGTQSSRLHRLAVAPMKNWTSKSTA